MQFQWTGKAVSLMSCCFSLHQCAVLLCAEEKLDRMHFYALQGWGSQCTGVGHVRTGLINGGEQALLENFAKSWGKQITLGNKMA